MKRIYTTLVEAIPRAMPSSHGAGLESVLDRLRANRGMKAMTVVAILSTTILLTGCGDNNGNENKPGVTGDQRQSDKIENTNSGQENKSGSEVKGGDSANM